MTDSNIVLQLTHQPFGGLEAVYFKTLTPQIPPIVLPAQYLILSFLKSFK